MLLKNKLISALFITLFSMIAIDASAKRYDSVDLEKSHIQFSGVQNKKTAFTGKFKSFEVEASFDAENLEQSKVNVTIDLTSVESGSQKRDSILKKDNWFDLENTPRSYFKSESIQAVSEDIYEIKGVLEIKGITKPYRLKVEIREPVDLLHLSGDFTINRLDFDLGLGSWKNPDWVKHKVDVEFDITVKPK